jgi:hypothetical protein
MLGASSFLASIGANPFTGTSAVCSSMRVSSSGVRRGRACWSWPRVVRRRKPETETVHEVLVPDLDGMGLRLTRLGYPVKSLCETLNARPAEIRAFLRGRLTSGRMQELHQELLKLGVVA